MVFKRRMGLKDHERIKDFADRVETLKFGQHAVTGALNKTGSNEIGEDRNQIELKRRTGVGEQM